jgi:hypothetical protein
MIYVMIRQLVGNRGSTKPKSLWRYIGILTPACGRQVSSLLTNFSQLRTNQGWNPDSLWQWRKKEIE